MWQWMILFLHVSPLEGKDVRQQPAQQFGAPWKVLQDGGNSSILCYGQTSAGLAQHPFCNSVCHGPPGHLHRQDLHDRR